MTIGPSPMVRRKLLGDRLRELRERRGYTMQALAGELGWSHTKLSRLENAKVRADVADVMDLAEALGASEDEASRLITLARQANQRGWWRAYSDVPQRQAGSAELESRALTIAEFSSVYIPGLLQTREYAAVRLSEPSTDFNVDAAVEMRLARQSALTTTQYHVILDESVLRRATAPADVYRAQLRHLAEAGVMVQVLPFAATLPYYARPLTSFSLYALTEPNEPELAIIETETSDLQLGDPEDLSRYREVWDRMKAVALSKRDSVTLISEVANES